MSRRTKQVIQVFGPPCLGMKQFYADTDTRSYRMNILESGALKVEEFEAHELVSVNELTSVFYFAPHMWEGVKQTFEEEN